MTGSRTAASEEFEEHAGLERYRRGLRRRGEEEIRERIELAAEARRAAERCARRLTRDFGATEVWLIGSTTSPHSFRRGSDIDLVVRGLPPEDFYRAGAIIEEEASPFAVDIMDMDVVSPYVRERIIPREGVRLA